MADHPAQHGAQLSVTAGDDQPGSVDLGPLDRGIDISVGIQLEHLDGGTPPERVATGQHGYPGGDAGTRSEKQHVHFR